MDPPMTEPRTAAGRALLAYELATGADGIEAERVISDLLGRHWEQRDAILAIEAEARAAALDEARAAADSALWDLEGPNASHPGIRVEYRRRVMTAIDALREKP